MHFCYFRKFQLLLSIQSCKRFFFVYDVFFSISQFIYDSMIYILLLICSSIIQCFSSWFKHSKSNLLNMETILVLQQNKMCLFINQHCCQCKRRESYTSSNSLMNSINFFKAVKPGQTQTRFLYMYSFECKSSIGELKNAIFTDIFTLWFIELFIILINHFHI